ncbi:MAG: cadherin-like domain-containing protein [Pseudobdellovibrio sp.]
MKLNNLKIFILFIVSLMLYSCGQSGGNAPSLEQPSSLPPATPTAVVIAPTSVTLAVNNTFNFTASGGTSPYTYSIFSGSGSVLSTTGNYSSGIVAGSGVVRVTDALGQVADAIITINAALQISPVSQSLNINNTQSFSTTGGVSPIAYSLFSGTGSVNTSTGLYTAPAVAGSAVIRATDSLGNISDASVNIFDSLGISPTSPTVSINGSISFSAAGGSTPYSYTVLSGSGSIDASTGLYSAGTTPSTAVVRVTDALSNTADANITIINAAPVISVIADQNASEDLVWPVNFNISDVDSTLNCSTSMSASSSNVGLLPVSNIVFSGYIPNCTATLTPLINQTGTSNVVLSVTDGLSTTTEAFAFNVSAQNDAPVLAAVGAQFTNEDTPVVINFTVSDIDSTLNCASSLSAATSNSSLVTVGNIVFGGTAPNCTATVTPEADATGSVNLTFNLSDGSLIDSETFALTINAVNDAPVLGSVGAQSTNEDTALVINFTASDLDSSLNCATSLTGATSNSSLVTLGNIVFGGSAPNCTATVTPEADATGSVNLTFTLSDGSLIDAETFTLTIAAVNDTPVLSSVSSQSVNEDSAIVVNFTITDGDSTLNCSTSMTASTSNVAVVPVAAIVFGGTAPNCSATITPLADQNGSLNLTFRVSDSEPLFNDQTFTLTVNAVNDAPTIAAISAQSVKSDASVVVNYSIADIDNTLNCSSSITVSSGNVSVLPTANIVKGGTSPNCTLTITPTLNVAGTSSVSLSVSDGSLAANTSFNLNVISVTSVSVTPASFSLAATGNQQLVATANYSDASSAAITTSIGTSWASSATGIATVNNSGSKGLASGVSAGSSNITANYKSVTSNTSVVTVITATSLSVSTGAVSGGIGAQFSVTATAQNSSSTFDVTSTAVWTSSNNSIATVTNGIISLVSAGNTIITVTYAGYTATVNVTVANKTLSSIAVTVSGGGSSVSVSGTKNLIATATYTDASTQVITNSVVWSSANSSVLTASNTLPNVGRVTGIAAGTSNVTATMGAVSGDLLLTVNSVTLSSITITPNDPLVTSGSSYSLRATATYSDASTSDVTDLVTWASSNATAATISNNSGSKGVATTPVFTGYRTTNITATLSSVTGTTPFGVNGSTILSIIVTPTVTITANQTYQLGAYANLSDGGVLDVSEFAVWSSSSTSNVSISNSVGSKGLVTGIANGTSTITAQFGGVSGTRVVTVAASGALTEIGTGLLGTYYTWTGSPPPAAAFVLANKKGQRTDMRVNFAWAAGNAPMGVGDQFAVRWTGFYKATSATNYFCTYSDDGIRIWINGVQLINNWTEHGPTWNCSANVALTVGTKYSVVVEYYENGGGSQAHLTRSSVSAADAQNTTTRAIQQVDLYPQ